MNSGAFLCYSASFLAFFGSCPSLFPQNFLIILERLSFSGSVQAFRPLLIFYSFVGVFGVLSKIVKKTKKNSVLFSKTLNLNLGGR